MPNVLKIKRGRATFWGENEAIVHFQTIAKDLTQYASAWHISNYLCQELRLVQSSSSFSYCIYFVITFSLLKPIYKSLLPSSWVACVLFFLASSATASALEEKKRRKKWCLHNNGQKEEHDEATRSFSRHHWASSSIRGQYLPAVRQTLGAARPNSSATLTNLRTFSRVIS